MGNIEVQPLQTFGLTAGEAISAGMACMIEADGTVKKLVTDISHFCGIAKYDAALGEAVTLQTGLVHISVDGAGSAGAAMSLGAAAGLLTDTATGTDPIVGYALETWTAAATIRAFVYPAFVRLAIA